MYTRNNWLPEVFNDFLNTDRERLEATSPALHADRIRVPLFVAQGAHDPRGKRAPI